VGGICSARGGGQMRTNFSLECLQERRYLEVLGIDKGIVLNG
jgi:hypothetical protein